MNFYPELDDCTLDELIIQFTSDAHSEERSIENAYDPFCEEVAVRIGSMGVIGSQAIVQWFSNEMQAWQIRAALTALTFTVDDGKFPAEVIEIFGRAIDHTHPNVRADAIRSLRYAKQRGVFETRILTFEHDESPYVRGAVLEYINFLLGPQKAYPKLLIALKDPDPIVVQFAVDLLGDEDLFDAIPCLELLIEHSNSQVREAVGYALVHLREIKSVLHSD